MICPPLRRLDVRVAVAGMALVLAASDSSIDIMSLDPPFIPEFAEPGFLAEVPEDLQGTEGIVQGAVDSATWDDELVAVPFWANTQLLWYRKSVVEQTDLDMSEPVTWEQIIEAASDNDKLLGVQGRKAESLTVWINALVASAGGEIIVDPGAPADEIELDLDSEAGQAAAEMMARIGSERLAGPGLPTADEEVLDDIGWAVYPRVDEDTDAAPPVGGINLGVGAFSENVDLAYEAVECISSPENQSTYFLSDGNPPSATEAYEDDEVAEEFPMAEVIRDSLETAVPRPQTPFYNEISIGLQNTWHPPAAVDPDTTPASSNDYITAVLRGERLL